VTSRTADTPGTLLQQLLLASIRPSSESGDSLPSVTSLPSSKLLSWPAQRGLSRTYNKREFIKCRQGSSFFRGLRPSKRSSWLCLCCCLRRAGDRSAEVCSKTVVQISARNQIFPCKQRRMEEWSWSGRSTADYVRPFYALTKELMVQTEEEVWGRQYDILLPRRSDLAAYRFKT